MSENKSASKIWMWLCFILIGTIILISINLEKPTTELTISSNGNSSEICGEYISDLADIEALISKQQKYIDELNIEIDAYNETITALNETIDYLSAFSDISLDKINFGVLTDIGKRIKELVKTKSKLTEHRDNLIKLKEDGYSS